MSWRRAARDGDRVSTKTTIQCDAPGCASTFSLSRGGLLIRCIAENKEGWRCEDKGGRDFCAEHRHLADPARADLTPRTLWGA
jgi:hypothetical protein